jgi:hypothetical protein
MEMLHMLGLALSYGWINETVREMAQNNRRRLKSLVQGQPYLISMDNVNRQIGVRNASLTNKPFFDNSTAGLACSLRRSDLIPENTLGIPLTWYKRGERNKLPSSSMAPSALAVDFWNSRTKAIVINILQEYIPEFKPNRKKFFPNKQVQKLSVEVPDIFTFSLMDVEQGSVGGNRQSLRRAVFDEMGYKPEDLMGILILVSGDHLTMDRYRSLRMLHQTDTVGEQFGWILPLFGLFHMQMNYLKMVFKNHFGDATGRDPSTLKSNNNVIQRPNVKQEATDFWSAMDLVNDTLDSDVLGLLISQSGCQSFSDFRQKLIHSTSDDGSPVISEGHDDFNWFNLINEVSDRLLRMNSVAILRVGEDGDNHNPIDTTKRDAVFENVLLRIRHSMQFREFYDSVRAGDIGRISAMIELLTPQFLGGKQFRYASELMEHMCGVRIEYSRELKEIILSNWVINPFGKEGHFLAQDEFMEEVIRHIKQIYNPGGKYFIGIIEFRLMFVGPHTAERYTREHVARLIWTMIQIKRDMRQDVLDRGFGGNHSKPQKLADIAALLSKNLAKGIYKLHTGRGFTDGYTGIVQSAVDWMQEPHGSERREVLERLDT